VISVGTTTTTLRSCQTLGALALTSWSGQPVQPLSALAVEPPILPLDDVKQQRALEQMCGRAPVVFRGRANDRIGGQSPLPPRGWHRACAMAAVLTELDIIAWGASVLIIVTGVATVLFGVILPIALALLGR
jgi:hypothetical protein